MIITHQFQFGITADLNTPIAFDPYKLKWPDWLIPFTLASKYSDHSIYIRNNAWHLCTKQHGECTIPISHYITLDDNNQLDISAEEQSISTAIETTAIETTAIEELITPTPEATEALTEMGIDIDLPPAKTVIPTDKKPPRKPRKRKSKAASKKDDL